MAGGELLQDGHVVGVGLVMHHPAGGDELQLPAGDQPAGGVVMVSGWWEGGRELQLSAGDQPAGGVVMVSGRGE